MSTYTIRATMITGLLAILLALPLRAAEDKYDKAWSQAIKFLQTTQNDDGSWGNPQKPGKVGITAVVLEALTMAPETMSDATATMKKSAAAYLAAQQQEDGAIHDPHAPKNYSTSLSVTALAKFDEKAYAPVIAKAVKWIKGIQANRAAGFDPDKHYTFGGFGYGSSSRPDLSNTWIALNALKDAGVPKDDPVWKDVEIFVKRCQNSTEVNDLSKHGFIGNDGGAKYLPSDDKSGTVAELTKAEDGRVIYTSYGSMSYAMMLSYLWMDMKKDDLPVREVTRFLADNYAVDRNPNTKSNGQQGLYYYYRVMAKALNAYGEKEFAGHNWAKDLADAIVERQRKDGSWINDQDRWQEGDPALATGYTLSALALAQKTMTSK